MRAGTPAVPGWIPAPYRGTGQALRGNDGEGALQAIFRGGLDGYELGSLKSGSVVCGATEATSDRMAAMRRAVS